MTPLLETVKAAFGGYLGAFYAEFVPDTTAGAEWASRGQALAMAWVPGRMIDSAEAMLESWRKNSNTTGGSGPASPGGTAFLPAMLVAMGKDWTPITGDVGRQVSERLPVALPDDVLARLFHLRVMQGEVRVQVAVFAAEGLTAGSIVAQLCTFLSAMDRRTFQAVYQFAGQALEWPVQVQTPDVSAISVPGEQQNLSILTVDLTLRVSIPLFDAPRASQDHDGQGEPGSTTNPAGYPVVLGVASNGRTVAEVEP